MTNLEFGFCIPGLPENKEIKALAYFHYQFGQFALSQEFINFVCMEYPFDFDNFKSSLIQNLEKTSLILEYHLFETSQGRTKFVIDHNLLDL